MIDVPNMREGYPEIVKRITRHGRSVAPRGQATLELPDVVIKLRDPADALAVGCGRKLNLGIAAAEAVQLIGGFSDPGLMVRVSSNFSRFLEPDGTFWGGYGQRVGPQLVLAAQKLTHDRDTRQAVVTLWDPCRDNVPGKLDYPCTLSLTFQIRSDELELHVTMRSNDAWLGLPYDVFQFTQLQLTMARALAVRAGDYYHHAISLHLYERDFTACWRLRTTDASRGTTDAQGFGTEGGGIFTATRRARRVGQFEEVRHPTASEKWYQRILEPYRAEEEETS